MRFRVMTYNIHRAIGVDRRFSPERMIRIIESHEPDILLLQEVDDGVPRSRELDLARDLAARLGYPYVAVGHNVALRKGRYGNATLSRHPILRERNIDLTIGLWKRRGCQHTAIVLNGHVGRSHRLEVFNLHLGLSGHQRELQVALLARSRELASLATTDVACLVGGDFNDWRSRLQPLFTLGLKFRSATDRSLSGKWPIPTYPAFLPRGPLDNIYYRGPLRLLSARRCQLRLARIASDHLPIVADFEIH
jgi:endonuclease/exonuclease/phosphatase family metal-dependent hydrolase